MPSPNLDWDRPGLRSIDDAELVEVVNGKGITRGLHLYLGGLRDRHGGSAGKPHAFLVHMLPDDTIGVHFHRVGQFQVFFGATAAVYQRRPVPPGTALVQYADSYSSYGPFSSGPQGLDFFTLRAVGDDATEYLPQSRAVLAEHRTRRRVVDVSVAVGPDRAVPAGEARWSILLSSESDQMACFMIEAGPNTTVYCPSSAGTGGHYYCVLGGEASCDNRCLGAKSLAWVPPDGDPLTLHSGGNVGFTVVVLQFPRSTTEQCSKPVERPGRGLPVR
jgi:hypothetical protein